MDAFASASLTPPPPSKMSEDAAMCRYGQASKVKKLAVTSFTQRCLLFSDNSSLFATLATLCFHFRQQRGEACDRAGIKKKGIEDGKVDRGNFEKCKENWEMKGGKWESQWICG